MSCKLICMLLMACIMCGCASNQNHCSTAASGFDLGEIAMKANDCGVNDIRITGNLTKGNGNHTAPVMIIIYDKNSLFGDWLVTRYTLKQDEPISASFEKLFEDGKDRRILSHSAQINDDVYGSLMIHAAEEINGKRAKICIFQYK